MDVERTTEPSGSDADRGDQADQVGVEQPVDRSPDRSVDQSVEQAVARSVVRSVVRSVDQSVVRSVDKSVEQAVVRSFVRKGRVVSMPASQSKRLVLLRWLRDQCVAGERAYAEREVNERLAAYHEDFAMLRRYMIDAGFLTRSDSGSEYRQGPA